MLAEARKAIAPIGRPIVHRIHALPRPREFAHAGDYVRRTRAHWRLRREGYTMLLSSRARNLLELAERVEAAGIPGALVDCGVWNGGSTMMLSSAAPSRQVWAFDSFEGVPEPAEVDGARSQLHAGDWQGSEEKLRGGFERMGHDDRLRIVKGWFEDTFPQVVDEVGPVALLHVDSDWYEPVKLTLETFYPLISKGGFVAIDDYRFWPGTKKAVDEFRATHNIDTPLERSHFWGKH
jgi:O-methyltransferase